MYKPLSDSTLMNMTKKEIIERLRIAEHNHRVCEETIDQQYRNCMELLKKERADAIDDVERELLANGFIFTEHALEVWHNIAEQLKEKKNESK